MYHLKRALSAFMALLLLLFICPACARDEEKIGRIKIIYTEVYQAGPAVEEITGIITSQIEESEAEIAAAKEARSKGEDYTFSDDTSAAAEEAEKLRGCLAQFEDSKKLLDALSYTGAEQIDKTIDAGRAYFHKLIGCAKDLLSIVDFFLAEEEALTGLNAAAEKEVTQQYGYTAYIADMWTESGAAYESLKAIPCPAFMAQSYALYIDQIRIFQTMLETMYYALTNEDVLSAYSAQNMASRIDITLFKYGVRLTEDFNKQYGKVGERISTTIKTLGEELKANCTALIKALNQEG